MGAKPRKMDTTDSTFATNLRVARRARGMTLDALAAAVGQTATPMFKSGLSKVETGSRTVTVGEAVNLCGALGVSLDQMLCGPISVEVRIGE